MSGTRSGRGLSGSLGEAAAQCRAKGAGKQVDISRIEGVFLASHSPWEGFLLAGRHQAQGLGVVPCCPWLLSRGREGDNRHSVSHTLGARARPPLDKA